MIPLVKVGMPKKEELLPFLEETLYSGTISEGDLVYMFEDEFLKKFGYNYGISMSSGTAALHCSLKLSGVEPGDEVITTSLTAEPTNISILQVGATPVFADVDPKSGNIDPESIESKITTKTKAILVVHYAGIPVRLNEILKISRKHKIPLIEDCAHALGSMYGELGIGSQSDFAIFSFQAIKHMTCVDGGFLLVKNPSLIADAKKFRWFGMEKGADRRTLDISSIGYKYNFTNVGATIGLSQLKSIDEKIAKHIDNGRYLDSEIGKISGLDVPQFDCEAVPSYWLYTVLSDDSENVEKIMTSIGVSASKLHRPNHRHSLFNRYMKSESKLPYLEEYYRRMIHIPCGWWLNNEQREMIVEALKRG